MGGHLSINDFWDFHFQKLATDNTSGFICCSEVVYVLKENYSILD